MRLILGHVEKGTGVLASCALENLHARQFYTWKKELGASGEDMKLDNKTKCPAPKSDLGPIETNLLKWVQEKRDRGMIISCPIIAAKASLLCSTFRDKSMNAKLHSVYRFSRRHNLVYRVATHESQRPPSAVHGEAMDFMTITRPRVHAYFRNANS